MRNDVRLALRPLGYRVAVAADGVEDVVHRHRPGKGSTLDPDAARNVPA
jgi:hypothetical protein